MSKRKAYWVWDIPAETVEGGAFLYNLFDIKQSEGSIPWKIIRDKFSEKDQDIIRESIVGHLKTGGSEPFNCETSHIDQETGKAFQVLWFGEVIQWSQDGKPTKMSGLAKRKVKLSSQKKLSDLDSLLFTRLMEHLNESIFFKDIDSRFILINSECASKFGIENPKEAIGKTDADFFGEEHAREAFQDEQKVLATEEPIIQKVEREDFPDSDKVLWASTTKMPLYDDDGELIGVFGITRDVTDQKNLEIELEYSREMFDKLSELAPGFLFLHKVEQDNTIRFPFASEGIQELFGLEPSDIKYSIKPLLKRVHREDVKRVLSSIMESVTFTTDWNCEYRIYHPEKGLRWVRGLAKPVQQEDGSVLSPGYLTDITEMKEAAERSDKLRLQFQSILNAIPNLIFIKDKDGKYIVVNDAACEFFRISRENFIGKTDVELGVRRDRVKLFRSADFKVMETGEAFFIPEIKTVTPDGEEYWHQTIKLPYKQIDGAENAVLTIVTDITDRKQRESELDNSLEIIGQQNQRLTNFAHIVSHNLRNHAGNISMLLSLYDPEESEEEREEILGYLKTAAENLNESIADLNEIVDQQQMTIDQFREVNLKEHLTKIKEILVSDILSNNVRFEEEIPENLTFGYNPAYLESILLNLISNAIKYRKPEVSPKICIKAYAQDGHYYLHVTDNGLGIDLSRHREKLFGMYKTFHGNENAKGIGLFITKNQIESMGGSIHVESEPGEGTTFKIKLK